MTDPSQPLSFAAAFERTLRLSRFCARLVAAQPGLAAGLEQQVAAPFAREAMLSQLEPAAGEGPAPGVRLRRLRAGVMLALAHRDLNGLASLDEVLATMSELADVTIGFAATEAQRALGELHGQARAADGSAQALIVAGLGKLGGGELNVSSDVDLVFAYGEEGETSGPRAIANSEYFALAGKRLIALLDEVTDEGRVFRVDMRLRPFGDAGPLVSSLASLEAYFVGQARPWERYAWLKSRVLSGPAEGLEALVRPFVYRRYLDYGLLAALRELHAQIFEAAVHRRKTGDIKVGAGGIREVEFVIQLHQLLRGGRDRELQTTSTRAALRAEAAMGLVTAQQATELAAAYAFLRKLEHRLQYHDDQQTQALPAEPGHRALIAEAMGFASYDAMFAVLEQHRAIVQAAFNALFESAPRVSPASNLLARLNDPQAAPDLEGFVEDLATSGIDDAPALAQRIVEYSRSTRYRSLSAAARTQIEALLPLGVAAAVTEGAKATTAIRLLDLIEAIGRREAYLSLLVEYPQVLARAARLVARSAWAARLLARHPILLDELTRNAASFAATDWAFERAQLQAECDGAGSDTERLLDLLRHFKQRHMLRFTIADLEGELPVMALSDELSRLADAILDATLCAAARATGLDAQGAGGFAVIGYGKLGSKELSYGSDLDIIFLYDEALADNAEAFARTSQRVNAWLTSHTPAGVLYETDLRLRPDGAAGLLVSSVAAFADYQSKRAWTWEHQALTRARFCAGDPALGKRFDAVRDAVLALPREQGKLFAEIVAMRRKMHEESKAHARDLKHVAGGLVDLEFCVQAIVLAHGPTHPKLRENRGNHQLLHWAGELGLIDAEVANAAAEAYLAMRRRNHEAALNDEDRVLVADDELVPQRAAVRKLWQEIFEP